jgi:rare lipoprotein A
MEDERRGDPSRITIVLALLVALTACATRNPPAPAPRAPAAGTERTLRTQVGLASFYGPEFHGRRTASGRRFDMRAPVAAHPSYPFGTRVRVTNLTNRRHTIVTIVDRGPSGAQRADGVIIDVSQGTAERLAFVRAGRTRVRVDVLEWGDRRK